MAQAAPSLLQMRWPPESASDVPANLTERLNGAYARFLDQLPANAYASVDDKG